MRLIESEEIEVAQKRMFSKEITSSARFLMMPQTSRLLYYDLGMAADDDGIVEAFTVLRMTGAADDDLRVLAAKNFIIILNEDLVSYITDWKVNNTIRTDRYKESIYRDLLVRVVGFTDGLPDGNQLETQTSIGKNSIDQNSIGKAKQGEPTLEEVKAYCYEIGSNADPERFFDYYSVRGWKVGNDPVRDWKALFRSWGEQEKPVKTTKDWNIIYA